MPKLSPESVDRAPADILFGELDQQLGVLRDLQQGSGQPPDFSEVLQSDQWQQAPAEVKRELREKYALPAPANSVELEVDWEAELNKRKPRPRVFTGYRLDQDPKHGYRLIEKGRIYNQKEKQYEDFAYPPVARIELSPRIQERMADPEFARQVLDFCVRLRQHLGEGGLNLHFDQAKDAQGQKIDEWRPKWKYTLNDPEPGESREYHNEYMQLGTTWSASGRKVEDPGEMPADIYALVEQALKQAGPGKERDAVRAYRQDPTYRQWYGKAIQAQREAIISRQLAEQDFVQDAVADEPGANEPVAAAEPMRSEPEPDQSENSTQPRASLASRFAKAGLAAARRTARAVDGRRKSSPQPAADQEPLAVPSAEIAAAGAVETDLPGTSPEPEPVKPEFGLSAHQLSEDAAPLIGPFLEVYRKLEPEDREAQARKTTKAVMRELADRYRRSKVVTKQNEDQFLALAETVLENVRQRLENTAESADAPVSETRVELAADDWRKTIRSQMIDQVNQADRELKEAATEGQKRSLVEGLTRLLTQYRQTFYSEIDFDRNQFTLRNQDALQRLILERLKPKP